MEKQKSLEDAMKFEISYEKGQEQRRLCSAFGKFCESHKVFLCHCRRFWFRQVFSLLRPAWVFRSIPDDTHPL